MICFDLITLGTYLTRQWELARQSSTHCRRQVQNDSVVTEGTLVPVHVL